jgi:hypothetical protein
MNSFSAVIIHWFRGFVRDAQFNIDCYSAATFSLGVKYHGKETDCRFWGTSRKTESYAGA